MNLIYESEEQRHTVRRLIDLGFVPSLCMDDAIVLGRTSNSTIAVARVTSDGKIDNIDPDTYINDLPPRT